jgi:hypothetical protein
MGPERPGPNSGRHNTKDVVIQLTFLLQQCESSKDGRRAVARASSPIGLAFANGTRCQVDSVSRSVWIFSALPAAPKSTQMPILWDGLTDHGLDVRCRSSSPLSKWAGKVCRVRAGRFRHKRGPVPSVCSPTMPPKFQARPSIIAIEFHLQNNLKRTLSSSSYTM